MGENDLLISGCLDGTVIIWENIKSASPKACPRPIHFILCEMLKPPGEDGGDGAISFGWGVGQTLPTRTAAEAVAAAAAADLDENGEPKVRDCVLY